jgi:hypothetical protein
VNEPRRLLEAGSDDFERDVLRSAKGDQASERALRRTLVSIGVGLAVTPAAIASAVPATVTLGSKLGTFVLAKWLFTGVALGVVTAGTVGLSERVLERQPVAAGRMTAKATTAGPQVSANESSPASEGSPAPTSELEASVPAPAPSTPALRAMGKTSALVEAARPPALAAEPPPTTMAPPVESAGTVERLAQETSLLDIARGALLRGDAKRALATLTEYEQSFARGMLAPEARVLRVRALLANGQRAAAEELAARVVEAAPNGEHADAVRALMGRSSNR